MTGRDTAKKTENTESTFVVHIKHLQNRTWQGELIPGGNDDRTYFRSELELLHLIQDSLEEDPQED